MIQLKRLVLAPSVEIDLVRLYARALRKSQRRFALLYLLDLVGRRVRKPELKLAKSAKVRIVDIESLIPSEILQRTAHDIFGESGYLYREVDDEDTDICAPGAEWLEFTFHSDQLTWLLEPEETPIPWNKTPFYAYPGNPDTWDVTVPIHAGLLTVARPGEPRLCPVCRTEYTSKRQDECQCPNTECNFVARPFASITEAMSIAPIPLDAFGWGRCPRCRLSHDFARQVEQCARCGQLLHGSSNRHKLDLSDNSEEITSLLSELFSDPGKGMP
jgi:hypothetical protein